MRRIPLTKGKEALVDDKDYEYLRRWSWCFASNGYAVRGDKAGMHLMHVVVAGRKYRRVFGRVDHRNRHRLDNRRRNLRQATQSENGGNRGPNRNNTSGYKGVHLHRATNLWRAEICKGRRRECLGYFSNKREAAQAYNRAARRLFGRFAYLNPV